MSFTKKINVNDGSSRKFEDVTTSEVVYDATPQLGSFNPVTSDGVAKAISGASGEVPAVNPGDDGKVLTAGFDGDTPTVSWQDAAAPYTAGDGIAISDSNVISCTVQGPTAGNGIDIQNGEISVKHDSTLTNVGGRQTVELTPSIEFSYHTYSSRPAGWYWDAYSMTVPAEDANSVNFTISVDSYLTWPWGDIDPAGKQVVGIVAKPTDPTAYYVAALKDSNYENVYVNEFRTVGSGTYEIPNSSRAEIYKQNLSGIGAAIVDGKVTVALGLYDQTQHTLVTSSDSYGPLYNGVPLYVYNLANTVVAGPEGDTPVEPGPDASWMWKTGSNDPITKTIGEGTASLSVANPVPSVDGHTGEFLKAGSNGPEWDTVDIPSYTAGDGIKIENNAVSAYHGETLVDKALPLAAKTGAESRAAFIGAGNWSYYTALKVSFGDIVPNSTLLTVSIKNSDSSSDVILAMPYTTVDPDLGGKKVKVVFANPDNKSNYIEARYASNVEITQGTGSQGSYNAKVSAPAVLFNNSNFQDGFDWHDLTLADIQGADGTTLMYVVACASDGTLITTGSYGPTDNLWTVGFGNGYLPSATTYALVEMPSNPVGFEVKNPVPDIQGVANGSVLAKGSSGMEWVAGGVPYYTETTSAYVSIVTDNSVVTSTADVTSIIVGAGVKSAIVQWVVTSTTTLPTVVDSSNNPLKASVNNPASLTVGRTLQVSILNGTWVCAEFA